jgi:UDP-N-acetylmuramyl pentapeptide phosphotransferase/UDP-N-acetylglucosamine-1-phosphate transferase
MPWEYVSHVVYVSFCATLLLLWGFLVYVPHRSFERGEKHRGNRDQFLRWGGVLAMSIFLFSLFWDGRLILTQDIWWMIVGIVGFLFLGVWDDARHISWKWQLFWQGAIVLFVITGSKIAILDIPNIFGGRMLLGEDWYIMGSILAFLWFLFLMNALNWIDGVDGLAPGILVVTCILLGVLSLRPEVYQPPLAIISFGLAGSFLGLYMLNIFPARLILGTTGVYVGGFVVAYLSVFAGAKIATAFLLLSIPLLDMFRVVIRRFLLGKSLALPDRNHIHYVLRDTFHWKEKHIAFFLVFFVFFVGILSLAGGYKGKWLALCLVMAFFFLLFLKEKE